jgi:hypothetical protein
MMIAIPTLSYVEINRFCMKRFNLAINPIILSALFFVACHPSIVQPYNSPNLPPKLNPQHVYLDVSILKAHTKIYLNDRFIGYRFQYPKGQLIIDRRFKRLLLKHKGYANAYYLLNTPLKQDKILIQYPLIKLPLAAPNK